MARARQADRNQSEIVSTLRQLGAHVVVLGGVVDLLVWAGGRWWVCDVKNTEGRNRLTSTQQGMIQAGLPIVLLRSVDDAVALVERALEAAG